MKEDYLWDKSGADAEIQALENALKAFRCKVTAPPALPPKVFVLEESHARRIFNFRLIFAFASCAAAVLILLGISFRFANYQTTNSNDFSAANSTLSETKFLPNPPAHETEFTKFKEAEPPQKIVTTKVVKIRRSVPAKPLTDKISARNIKPKNSEIALTKEEKYAYEQLMLALSITSSKLKMVKDKANGIEEQNASIPTER